MRGARSLIELGRGQRPGTARAAGSKLGGRRDGAGVRAWPGKDMDVRKAAIHRGNHGLRGPGSRPPGLSREAGRAVERMARRGA